MMKNLPDIFHYIDYHKYLSDVYSALKERQSKFSYRAFARYAGVSAPNYLQLILKRKLSLNSGSISSLAANLGLKKSAETYLEYLVSLDDAKTFHDKDKYYRRILRIKAHDSIKQLQGRQYDYFSNWYHPVVRELLVHPEYTGEPSWIAQRIFPAISAARIKKSIDLLQELRLIEFDAVTRKWRQLDTVVTTPSEVASFAVAGFHESMIENARNAVQNFDATQRDIRSVTLGLSRSGFQEIKKRAEAFWREILDFSATQSEPESVYQINMQLFPLVKQKRKAGVR